MIDVTGLAIIIGDIEFIRNGSGRGTVTVPGSWMSVGGCTWNLPIQTGSRWIKPLSDFTSNYKQYNYRYVWDWLIQKKHTASLQAANRMDFCYYKFNYAQVT